MNWRLVLGLLFLTTVLAPAASQTFEASSVKYLYKITLTQKKNEVSGVFRRSEYGVNSRKYPFRGSILPSRPGESGKRVAIRFSSRDVKKWGEPYTAPVSQKDLVWRLVPTHKGPRILVPMTWKSGKSMPTWKRVDVVFEPA